MKAKLIFNLPEDIDSYNLANKGADMWNVLWDFDQWLRSEIKYQNKDYDEIRKKLCQVMQENNCNFDMVS